MRKPDIRARVLFAALLPATVIALLLATFFITVRFNDLEDGLRLRGRTVARHLATAAEYGVFSGNRDVLGRLAESALAEADVVVLIGARLNWLLSHGKGKTWGGEKAASRQFIQIDIAPTEIDSNVPIAAPLIGDVG